MRVLVFVAALLALAVCVEISGSLSEGELEGLLEKKVRLHTDRLRQVYEQTVVGADDRLRRDQGRLWILKGYDSYPGCPGVLLKFQTFQNDGRVYAITATGAAVNNTHIYRFSKELGCRKLLATLPTNAAFDFAVITMNRDTRLVVVEKESLDRIDNRFGSRVYTLVFQGEDTVLWRKDEILPTSLKPDCIAAWTQYGVPHVAICNNQVPSSRGMLSNTGRSSIFCARGGHLDKCHDVESANPKKMKHFEIFSKHYLAVVNSPDLERKENIPAQVFHYDFTTSEYQPFQHLYSKGAVDVCFFTLGTGLEKEHFLVIVNQFEFDAGGNLDYNVNSYIYKFFEDGFVPFQSIPTRVPTSCHVYQPDEERMVLIFAEVSGAVSYQYDGWRFELSSQYTQNAMGPGLSTMDTSTVNGELYITASNTNPEQDGRDNFFMPQFEVQETLSDLYESALSWCRRSEKDLLENPINALAHVYPRAVKKNDSEIVLGRTVFAHVSAEQVFTEKLEDALGDLRVGKEMVEEFEMLKNTLNKLVGDLEGLIRKKDQVKQQSGTLVVNGPIIVNTLQCIGDCSVVDVVSKSLNDVDVDAFYDEAVYMHDTTLPANLRFDTLAVNGSVETTYLSGRNISDYFRQSGRVFFDGDLTVDGDLTLAADATVAGLVDGVRMSPSALILRHGDQHFNWTLNAERIGVERIDIGHIGGRDLGMLYDKAVRYDSDTVLISPKFESDVKVKQFRHSGLVNGVDIADLYRRSMKTSGDQIVAGFHTYNGTVRVANVTVAGKVNGISFPDKRLVMANQKDDWNIGSLTLLNNDTVFSQLNVSGHFAGRHITAGSEGKLLLKRANHTQVVTGKKFFQSLRSKAAVRAQSVNSSPVPRFETSSSIHGDPSTVVNYDNLVVNGRVTFQEDLSVGDVRNVNLSRLLASAVRLDDGFFPSLTSVQFEDGGVQVVGDLSALKIDGVERGDFVKKDWTTVVMTGVKEFAGDLTFTDRIKVRHRVNGHDLRNLTDECLRLTGGQSVNGTLVVKNDVDIKNLRATKTQLVPLHNVGVVGGRKSFPALKLTGGVTIDDLHLSGFLGGVDVNSLFTDTLLKNGGRQRLRSAKKFLKNIQAEDVDVHQIEGFDTSTLDDIVLSYRNETISGDVIIGGDFQAGHLTVDGSIDGVDADAPLSWLRYGVDQEVQGDLYVRGSLDVGDIVDTSAMVNDIDVDRMLADGVRINGSAKMASLHFGHLVVDNIDVGGLIQGVNVPSGLVLKDTHRLQFIDGFKTFAAPLSSGSLQIASQINGHDPNELCRVRRAPQSSNWVVYGNVTIAKDMLVAVESVNDDPLRQLITDAWMKDDNVTLNRAQHFSQVITEDFITDRLISNVDLADLNRRFVNTSHGSRQNISVRHQFSNISHVDELVVADLAAHSIGSVSWQYLSDSVLLYSKEQILDGIIFDNVTVNDLVASGLVNGKDVGRDFARHGVANNVTGKKIFDKLSINGNMDMCPGCTVDRVRLLDWFPRVVPRNGNVTIKSRVQFENASFAGAVRLHGLLNGVDFSRRSLMTLKDNQVLLGKLTFAAQLPETVQVDSDLADDYVSATSGFRLAARFADLSVSGSYQGVNLTRFYGSTLQGGHSPGGIFVFDNKVTLSALASQTMNDVAAESTLAGVLGRAKQFWANNSLGDHTLHSKMDSLVDAIEGVVSKHAVRLEYFEEADDLIRGVRDVDALHIVGMNNSRLVLCFHSEAKRTLVCGPQLVPVLESASITSVAVTRHGRFAVLTRETGNLTRASVYEWPAPRTTNASTDFANVHNITVADAGDCTPVTLANQSCFLFTASKTKSPMYCQSSSGSYYLNQELDDFFGRRTSVCYRADGSPIVAALGSASNGLSRIEVWAAFADEPSFRPWKTIVTSRVVAVDCACDDRQCYVATLSPSKPTAIPGNVIIWGLDGEGQPVRLQRIAVAEPSKVKFVRLPSSSLALLVLQGSGIDNVMMYVMEGLRQFRHATTIRVPGAKDMQVFSSDNDLLVAVVIKPVVTDVVHEPVRVFRAVFLGLLK